MTLSSDAGARRCGFERRFQVGRRPAGDADDLDVELDGLVGEQVEPVTATAQPDDTEQVGIAPDHVKGLGPDRSGRPQDHDVPALAHLTSVSYRPAP